MSQKSCLTNVRPSSDHRQTIVRRSSDKNLHNKLTISQLRQTKFSLHFNHFNAFFALLFLPLPNTVSLPKKMVELDSLYNKIGEENLWKLVDRFYELVAEDPILAPLFTTDMNVVKRKQFFFLSQFLGGPDLYNQEYGHPRLRLKHMPHKIDENTAVAWLKCMDDAIHTLDLPKQVKIELFNRFPQVAAHMVNTFDQS